MAMVVSSCLTAVKPMPSCFVPVFSYVQSACRKPESAGRWHKSLVELVSSLNSHTTPMNAAYSRVRLQLSTATFAR